MLPASAVRTEPEWTLSHTICSNSANDGAGPVRFGAGGASGAGALENPKYPLTAGGMGAATGDGGGGLASSAVCKLNPCGQVGAPAPPPPDPFARPSGGPHLEAKERSKV